MKESQPEFIYKGNIPPGIHKQDNAVGILNYLSVPFFVLHAIFLPLNLVVSNNATTS